MTTSDWRTIADAADREARAFEKALERPRQTQLDLLAEILAANARCNFGEAHAFAGMQTIEDFRAAVPIATYDAFAPAIARMADGQPELSGERPVAYELTGGSTTGSKLVPYTAAALEGFKSAILPWMHSLLDRHPAVPSGRFYATISPATRAPASTADGTPIGLASDAAYLGADLIGPFLRLLAVPPQIGAIADPAEWQVATLAALVEAEDLSFVSLWSPTFLLALLEALPALFDAVADRVAREFRQRLAESMRGGTLDTRRLWPRLTCISCWTDGPSRGFADELARRFPQASIDAKGVLATEAAITVAWGRDARRVPALTSCLIEFIGADGQALLCDELEAGATYGAVLTTRGGFYRYDIGDRFVCRDMQCGVPDLEFVGRTGLTSDLVGEKLDDAFVSRILADLRETALLAPRADGRGYEMLVGSPDDAVPGKVDAALCANPQYAYARRMGQLAPLRLRTVGNLSSALVERGLKEGRRMGDIKASGLLQRPFEEGSSQ